MTTTLPLRDHAPLGFDAGDANLYRYVRNRPTDRTDPLGRLPSRPRDPLPSLREAMRLICAERDFEATIERLRERNVQIATELDRISDLIDQVEKAGVPPPVRLVRVLRAIERFIPPIKRDAFVTVADLDGILRDSQALRKLRGEPDLHAQALNELHRRLRQAAAQTEANEHNANTVGQAITDQVRRYLRPRR